MVGGGRAPARAPLTRGFVLRITLEVCLLLYIAVYYHKLQSTSGGQGARQRQLADEQRARQQKHLELLGVSNVHVFTEQIREAAAAARQRGQLQEADGISSLQRELEALQRDSKLLKERSVASNVGGAALAQAHAVQQPGALSGAGGLCDATAFLTMEVAGAACHAAPATEYWGEPVVWGSDHHTDSAAECCAACWAHRRAAQRGGLEQGDKSTVCNVWVYCGDKDKCGGQYRECWLKNLKDLQPPPAKPTGRSMPGLGWTSGAVYSSETEEAYETAPLTRAETAASGSGSASGGGGNGDGGLQGVLLLHTIHGDIRVALRPDLAPGSVRELRRMARLLVAHRGGHCEGCHFYRSEKNFLLQGVIRNPGSYVAVPRHPNPPQQSVMERGLVCWAGGAGGPDFFVNVIDQAGFGDSHVCWGKITDMTLVDLALTLPLKPKAKPNDMTFLKDFIYFNISLVP